MKTLKNENGTAYGILGQSGSEGYTNEYPNRVKELSDLGMFPSMQYQSYIFQDVNVGFVEMQTMDEKEWSNLIDTIKPVLADRKSNKK